MDGLDSDFEQPCQTERKQLVSPSSPTPWTPWTRSTFHAQDSFFFLAFEQQRGGGMMRAVKAAHRPDKISAVPDDVEYRREDELVVNGDGHVAGLVEG